MSSLKFTMPFGMSSDSCGHSFECVLLSRQPYHAISGHILATCSQLFTHSYPHTTFSSFCLMQMFVFAIMLYKY